MGVKKMKKQHKTWLILNVRDGKFRLLSPKTTLKSLKPKLKAAEIPINLTMNVDVPETPILKAHGEIKLTQVQISELLLEEIEEEDEQQ